MNVTISIPPFPSQDLAKLVLGYLAEEQLMTAYDEFLQASPYLDAYGNEFDRIFMTSLKNILAEYRAVKIYVETCKPFILRRKLVQCPNLLEIVKFLVNNVDLNKLHAQEAGHTRHHSLSKSHVCDVCTSLKLQHCVCKSSSHSTSQIETSSLENSVETTSLADLPGNTSYRKKVLKVSESGNNIIPSTTNSEGSHNVCGNSAKLPDSFHITHARGNAENVISSNAEKSYLCSSNIMVKDNVSESKHPSQAYSAVPTVTIHSRIENECKQDDADAASDTDDRVCSAGTFQEFSFGNESSTVNKVTVPDSSTSENNAIHTPTTEIVSVTNSTNIDKRSTRPQILIRVGQDNNNSDIQPSTPVVHRLLPKEVKRPAQDQNSPKITILSDIKVDKDLKMPQILKNATSTPSELMQTLFINGTPAYKQTKHQNYTQDEIMAMPTIILVPASGNSKVTVPSVTQNNKVQNNEFQTATGSTGQSLGPLVIDVTSPDTASGPNDNESMDGCSENTNKQSNNNYDNRLLNTVDVTSHMSLPKDNVLNSLKSSTPHVLPPTRKSSSTPRRTSHIRVLDFATPRRILHETENEQENVNPSNEVAQQITTSLPVIKTSNIEKATNKVNNNISNEDTAISGSGDVTNGPVKENKTTIKLYNWDAQLRALAYAGDGNIEKSETTQKSKPKKAKKKVSPKIIENNKVKDSKTKKPTEKKMITPKSEKKTTRKKSIEVITDKGKETNKEDEVSIPSIPVKPTINIICRNKRTQSVEADKTQNKSNNSNEIIDTPEFERISLQNEIGAKLNISELLETPYKQALYDIQMETPKFLGPDIPDDPLSDIKIMSIPTPRFLNTPKVTQNTPSSYSSRPTDYSSGGSYYKPDDQDYLLATEVMECAMSMSVGTTKTKVNKESTAVITEKVAIEKEYEQKSRPVRKCTKNVSYYNNVSSKTFEVNDDKIEKSSNCSDGSINKPYKIDKVKVSKIDKESKKEKKNEQKKKSKKYKSPVKKETPKTFMKIKPRRTTPVKEVLGKARRKTSDNNQCVYIKSQPRKVVGKDKNVSTIPDLVPISTKSRRKSSTPRKIHCTKIFNSESSDLNPSENLKQTSKPNSYETTKQSNFRNQDSDTEQLVLQWSDSQESEPKVNNDALLGNESDDINKIKEYIDKTVPNELRSTQDVEGTLQVDLIKRGFDVATARMIERDLLENSNQDTITQKHSVQCTIQSISPSIISHTSYKSDSKNSNKNNENVSSSTSKEQHKDEDDNDEFDLSVHESNEETNNYFSYQFNEDTFVQTDQVKLKETFSMEICIEDESIRLRATAFNINFEQESQNDNILDNNDKRGGNAENPCHYDTLYTPRKAQCYEIFDSTLTSLDTPLKPNSPKPHDSETIAEIVEVEKIEIDKKQKSESKKRKRLQSESSNGTKKVKTDTPYLLNSANIQNIDIESVLSKLHGP